MADELYAKLDTINFYKSEMDFEADAGMPILISSISSPQVFDSYLMHQGRELKIYKPSPTNTSVNWDVKLLLGRDKISLINSLILKQINLVKKYRFDLMSSELIGFPFTFEDINTKVWLTNFRPQGAFYHAENGEFVEKVRCTLGLTETEVGLYG
jgi:hypothetical protein